MKVSRKKFAGIAAVLFFVGMFLGIYLNESKGTGFNLGFASIAETGIKEASDCYKYLGGIPEAYCDDKGNMHFYFTGNEAVQEGWIVREGHKECKLCDYLGEEK